MAVFGSELAFNINALDISQPFQGNFNPGIDVGGSRPLALPDLPIGAVSYPLPSATLTYEEELYVTWGGNRTSALLGNNLTYSTDGSAQIFSGTAVSISSSIGPDAAFGFAGFALSAADYSTAAHSASTVDDRAYVTRILAGNDLILLSGFNDVFNSGLGRDLILDQGGTDRINAGGGNDLVMAGKGNDRVDGSLGNDIVGGGAGNDVLQGGTGADVIWAGVGADTATGGLGADAFLFKAGDGALEITDFNAADDQLLFMGSAAGLANLSLVQTVQGVSVTFSDVSVLLVGRTLSQVSTADVAVGGNAALNAAAEAFFDGWTYFV